MEPKEEKESTDIKQEDTEPTEDKKEEKEPTEYHEATHTEEQGTLIDTEKVEQPDLFATTQKEESLSPKQEEDEAEQKSANETNQKEDSFAAFLSDNNL